MVLAHTIYMSNAASAPAAQSRCLRCGRKIKAGSYGRTCARKIREAALTEARADFSDSQQAKADELIRDGGIVPTNREGVFRSVSSKGDEFYLTHSQVCTCKAGLQGRRCYHLLAARVLSIASRRSLTKAA